MKSSDRNSALDRSTQNVPVISLKFSRGRVGSKCTPIKLPLSAAALPVYVHLPNLYGGSLGLSLALLAPAMTIVVLSQIFLNPKGIPIAVALVATGTTKVALPLSLVAAAEMKPAL